MKTVYLYRNFDYRAHRKWSVRFQAGITYQRVIEAAAAAIVRAGAGRVLSDLGEDTAGLIVDARSAFEPRKRRR